MAESNSTVDIQAAKGRLLVRFRDTICAKFAAEAEQTAKANALWTDRTGDARRLLKGIVIDDGQALGIALCHRVEYGKSLEKKSDGKYAILKPTIESIRQRVMSAWREFFGDRK